MGQGKAPQEHCEEICTSCKPSCSAFVAPGTWRCGRGGESGPFRSIDQEVFGSERLFLGKKNGVRGRGEAGKVALVQLMSGNIPWLYHKRC